MHLKSLTLKGFKSFASATTLRFEPGITCVVGPNGSGKSNVVDALAWVMGEQGAKSLRGGKMEDVIFAGTAGRPPLGRAEVSLTIDNSDGALPIEYSEVTISRIMFRNGGSEYSINGNPCRLLDIQELLSDSGIGREMHVIVGQGQLDSVLQASPEERRAFIEEAAGVLKHRKRKEKALRKLDSMQANMTRLQDLISELRRQLKPPGRQAEAARKAAVYQAELRDARLRLLADDLVTLRRKLEEELADERLIRERRARVEAELAAAQRHEAELDAIVQSLTPRLARAQEAWYRLSSLNERFRGTASLAAERLRHLKSQPEEERRGRDPEDMEREARQIREQETRLKADVAEAQRALQEAVRHRAEQEALLAAEEKRLQAALRAVADRREGLARLAGQVNTARGKVSSAEAELGRLQDSYDQARERAEQAQREYEALRAEVGDTDEADGGELDQMYGEAAERLAQVEERLGELRAAERDAERERAALTARKEALELGLRRKDGAGALLAASDQVSGLLGAVAALIEVAPGAEAAVAAALGRCADAVAVADVDGAVDALRLLRKNDAGRAGILVARARYDDEVWPALPDGARYAIDLVKAPEELKPSLARVLHKVAVVADLEAARRLLAAHPDVRAVTRDGDLLGVAFAHGGSADAPSLLEVQAAVDEATERLTEAEARCVRLRAELAEAAEERKRAKQLVDELAAQRREAEKRRSAVAQQLGRLGGQARAAAGEVGRLGRSIETAREALARHQAVLEQLEERLAAAEAEPDMGEPSTEERDRLSAACAAARQAEMEARLAVRTAEERVRGLSGRADALDRAARQERAARARALARRERMAREAAVASAVVRGCEATLVWIEASLARAAAERERLERARAAREAELKELRGRIRELSGELEQLTDSVHRDEMARTEQQLRIRQLEQQALEEFGIDAESLISEYGPDQPVPPSPQPPGETRDENDPANQPRPYDRAEQEKRLKDATRALALLGKVNPLALEEFAALEERHRFLTEQLEDLKASRRDLLTVIKDVDARVEEMFTSAYEDTAREFEKVFARLFPGGEGRLVLTDPDDMLTTGVEVEARPPGKKVKRLSLLSGGERSLTAVALLVAIFKARPSPFYVMDEVEAALDDTNLQRLLAIFEELRESSQLIIITHQKRTMEIADALYGVSMRDDGVTTVISQRLRERERV
ncbi:chromosome segregation protein SMC [Carbonactinospora thermoautotrophica]|uniref:chromosome segregation protein SMC n=1 Tax=Carbonactinospora thermoautotrophica TaxID=1469144 RepID=UPI003DA9A28F